MSREGRVVAVFAYLAAATVLALVLNGCGGDEPKNIIVDPPLVLEATCEGCHQDAEMLKATMEPEQGEPPESDPGEG